MTLKYISAPYGNATNKSERIDVISTYSANCLKKGQMVVCPLTMGHAFIKYADLPKERLWWMRWCLSLLAVCTEMDVLCIEGWDKAAGVLEEIKFATKHKININYIKV